MLRNKKEFDKWLERGKWITKKCDEINRELERYKAKVQAFEEIGTIEEFKALKDKNEPKELAEEYKNDFCEWEIVSDRDIHREYKPMCSEDGFIEMTGYFDYEFCPYCGKKIKVAPYQPKGE